MGCFKHMLNKAIEWGYIKKVQPKKSNSLNNH